MLQQCLKPIKQYTDSYFLSLADWEWALNPSQSAREDAVLDSSFEYAREIFIRLVRLRKSYTPSGDAYLAEPFVGKTWFGPAQ